MVLPICLRSELPYANCSLESSMDANSTLLELNNASQEDHSTTSPLESCSKSAVMCHLNSQSLMPKLDGLKLAMSAQRPVILGLSETWMDSSVMYGEVSVPGYVTHRKDRRCRDGGCIVYVTEEEHGSNYGRIKGLFYLVICTGHLTLPHLC